MPDIEKTFQKLTSRQQKALTTFVRHGVNFIVIGEYAEIYHTLKHRTCDLDLLVKASENNAERIVEALKKLGDLMLSLEELREKFRKPKQVGRCHNVEVDLLTSEEAEYEYLRERAIVEEWNELLIPIVSEPDLAELKNKKIQAMRRSSGP